MPKPRPGYRKTRLAPGERSRKAPSKTRVRTRRANSPTAKKGTLRVTSTTDGKKRYMPMPSGTAPRKRRTFLI